VDGITEAEAKSAPVDFEETWATRSNHANATTDPKTDLGHASYETGFARHVGDVGPFTSTKAFERNGVHGGASRREARD
jgi:hypothetical protein